MSAAASLTEAFGKIGTDFSAANPGATVTFNFGSSGTLATQIQQGAPADAFASADPANIDHAASRRTSSTTGATVFAKNKLVIVTKPGNPKHVKTLADLATVGIVSLCGETVPCGKYADQVLTDRRRHDPRRQDHARRGREGDARRGDHRRRRRRDRVRHRREDRRRGRRPR